jgi:hypothetical protein
LHHVLLWRVHSFTHSFPTRWIPREATQSAPPIGMPNYALPHTTPGRTHLGSWLYYLHWWSLHEPVHRFGYDNYHRPSESTGHRLELSEFTEHSSKPITCHTLFLCQNQVLIVYMTQDQLFHIRQKVITDNQISRIMYNYYINNVSKDYDDSQRNGTTEDTITP